MSSPTSSLLPSPPQCRYVAQCRYVVLHTHGVTSDLSFLMRQASECSMSRLSCVNQLWL